MDEGTELTVGSVLVSQQRQLVLDQRVINDVDGARHLRNLQAWRCLHGRAPSHEEHRTVQWSRMEGALRVRAAAAIAPLERGVDVWHRGAYLR